MPPSPPDRDDLADAARELVRSGRALTKRGDEVLAATAAQREELAVLRVRVEALERAAAASTLGRLLAATQSSPTLQRGVALALVIAVLAGASYLSPGVIAALPLLGAAHAP